MAGRVKWIQLQHQHLLRGPAGQVLSPTTDGSVNREPPPVMQDTWLCALGWEDPLEKEMATHSSILAWRIPWRILRGAWQATVHGVAKSQT